MANSLRVIAGVLVLLAIAAAGLLIYAQGLDVPQREVETVIPNERFAN